MKDTRFKEFDSIIEKMKEIHHDKNHDYAGSGEYLSNLTGCKRMGLSAWKGTLVRMQDKMSRLENFAKQNELKVKNESVEDTFIDLAVYSILGLILFNNDKLSEKKD